VEFADVVRARRMVRTYDPSRPVPASTVSALLDLAVRAPSAGFSQGWDFVVLRSASDRNLFWTTSAPAAVTSPDRWLLGMMTAPVLVLCLSDAGRYLNRYAEPDKRGPGHPDHHPDRHPDRDPGRWPVPYWDVDTGMAGLLILLGATDAGLASCFFGVPPDRRAAVLEACSAPSTRRIVGVIALGHPAPDGDRRSPSLRRGRRRLAEVAHDGRFGVPWPD
jgi:nitroreductase